MLRRQLVGDAHQALAVGDDQPGAVGLEGGFGDGSARQFGELSRELDPDCVEERAVAGHQHRIGRLVVLRLRQEIGRDDGSVGGFVRENEDFRRSGDAVDGNVAEHQALGGRDVDVAGADDLVHSRNRLGAKGQRGDGLRAAGVEERVDARQVAGGSNFGPGLGVATTILVHPGDSRWDRAHQHARGIASLASGSVHANPGERSDPRAQAHTILFVAEAGELLGLPLVKTPDALCRQNQGGSDRSRRSWPGQRRPRSPRAGAGQAGVSRTVRRRPKTA